MPYYFFLEELKFYAKGLGNYKISGIASYINPDCKPLEKKLITVQREQLESLIF